MSLSILNNIASLGAQNQLQTTSAGLQKTLFRLSSGSRINNAPKRSSHVGLLMTSFMSIEWPRNATALQRAPSARVSHAARLRDKDPRIRVWPGYASPNVP